MNRKTLKHKAITSMIWKFLERIAAQSISLIVSIVIARILDPSTYGTVGLVAIFFGFADIIISGGLNTALIQKKDADEEDYSSVFWVSILLSLVVYFALFLCAPTIAGIYKQPVLISIIRTMGIVLPVYAAKSIVCAYISSNLQFKKFFLATIGGTIVSGIIGIIMALKGFGPWALVAQQISNTIIDTIILYVSTRMVIRLRVSYTRLKRLFNYGWKILVSSVINTIYNEIRPLVIGVKFSTADLSFYKKGNSIPSLISTTTTSTLSAVLFPVLSEYQDDKETLLKYTRRFMQVASFLVFPLNLGLFVVSDNLILVLLTEKWNEAAVYMKIFSISSMFSMINVGNCETIKAMGRSDIFLKMEIVKKILYFIIIGIFILCSNSPIILAVASLLCTLVAIVVNTVPNRKLILYKYKDQIIDILPNLITAIIMCICVYFIGKINLDAIILLALQVLTGTIIYFSLNALFRNRSLLFCISFLKESLGRNTQTKIRGY